MTQEALSSLQALAEQLRARLLELPEFRVLVAIDRTIVELSQILNQVGVVAPAALTAVANAVVAPARVEAPPVGLSAATAIPAPAVAVSSHSRMAAAIAATIAARTANPPPAEQPRFIHSLAAAS